MTNGERWFVAVVTVLILLIIGGMLTDWYGVLSDTRPVPSPIGNAKPTRPPHPASIYYPPSDPSWVFGDGALVGQQSDPSLEGLAR